MHRRYIFRLDVGLGRGVSGGGTWARHASGSREGTGTLTLSTFSRLALNLSKLISPLSLLSEVAKIRYAALKPSTAFSLSREAASARSREAWARSLVTSASFSSKGLSTPLEEGPRSVCRAATEHRRWCHAGAVIWWAAGQQLWDPGTTAEASKS